MALKRYDIWDKTSDVVTPVGEVLTAEQWIERYPIAALITTVCGQKPINGSFFGVLGQMVSMYEQQGADFSNAKTDIEKLEVIEAFEDARNEEAKNSVSEETRTADALEDLVVLTELQNK